VPLLGLIPSHEAFALLLLTREEWTRAKLIDAAADLELLLDGALEEVNEAAYDHHDVPFTAGDDPVTISKDIQEATAA
jgi:hypothetical protein